MPYVGLLEHCMHRVHIYVHADKTLIYVRKEEREEGRKGWWEGWREGGVLWREEESVSLNNFKEIRWGVVTGPGRHADSLEIFFSLSVYQTTDPMNPKKWEFFQEYHAPRRKKLQPKEELVS